MPAPLQLWAFQELLYRIEVLEVSKLFKDAIPLATDMKVLMPHYKVVDVYFENLKKERVLPASKNTDVQKQRETALESFCSVIDDYRKRYGTYAPQSPEQYKKDIINTISTVLSAWIQYRNTINEIKLTEGK